MSESPAGELAQPASLATLLERAGVSKSSVIRVTGPSSLSALLWLCRHGYEQVGCIRADQGWPHEDQPDAILVAHTCGEPELRLLAAAARQLCPGGVLVVRLRAGTESSPLGLQRLLELFGLSVEHRIESGRTALIVARRDELAPARKAA
jgi:hypothetical protein